MTNQTIIEVKISNGALALLNFFKDPRTVLFMPNVENEMTDVAASAMRELISSGMVMATETLGHNGNPTGGVTYRGTVFGQDYLAKNKPSLKFIKAHGSFSLIQPRRASNTSAAASALMDDRAALLAIARAYDAEDAAQRGEPNPHNHCQDPDWIEERIACARAGLDVLVRSAGDDQIRGVADELAGGLNNPRGQK